MRILIFSLCLISASASGTRFDFSGIQPIGDASKIEACHKSHNDGDAACNETHINVSADAIPPVDAGSLAGTASAGEQQAAALAVQFGRVASACAAAFGSCKTTCKAAGVTENGKIASAQDDQKPTIRANTAILDRATLDCAKFEAFQTRAQTAAAGHYRNAGAFQNIVRDLSPAVASQGTNDTGSWLSRNGWTIGAGVGGLAAGGLGGYMLGKSAGEKEAKKEMATNQVAASPSPSASSNNGFTAASVDCSQSSNFTNTQCVNSLVQGCQINQNGTNCQLFANAYCGFGDGTDSGQGVVSNSGSPGYNTAYCKNTAGWRYCQGNGRNSCPSCVQQATMQNPVCVNNPTICVGQYSQGQLNNMKGSCPSDPYYTNYVSAANSSTSTSTALTTTTNSTNAPGAITTGITPIALKTAQATGGNPSTGSVAVAAAAGGSALAAMPSPSSKSEFLEVSAAARGPASLNQVGALLKPYEGALSEISQSFGQNLFQKTTSASKIWCDAVLCQTGT